MDEVVYSIEIETGDIPKRLDEIRSQLEANAAQIKAYQDQTKAGNKLTNEQARELLRLRDTQKILGREQQVLTQITTAASDSLDQQRKQLIAARLQWDRLTKDQRENSEQGKALKAQIDQLNRSVSNAEESTGRFQRGVGNYTNAIKEALVGSGAFGKGLDGIGAALKANPFGLLLSALPLIIGLFQKAQPVMDAVKVVMSGLGAVVEVLTQRAGALFNAFTSLITGDFTEAANSASQAFGSLGSSIAEAAREGANYAKVMKDVEDGLALLDVQESRLNIGMAALTKQLRDRTRTDKERIEIAKAIQSIEQANFNERMKFLDMENKAARQRLNRLLQQAGVQNVINLSDEQALKLAQENAIIDESWNKVKDTRIALNNREAESQSLIEAAQTRLNMIREQGEERDAKAREKRNADIEKQKQAQEKAAADAIALEQKRVAEFQKLSQAELNLQLKTTQEYYAQIERARKEQLANDLVAVAGNAEEEKRVRSQAEADLTQIKFDSLKTQELILNDYALTVEGVDAMLAANGIELAKLTSEDKIRILTEEYERRKAIADQQLKEDEKQAERTKQAFMQASVQIGQQVEQAVMTYKGDLQGFVQTTSAAVLKTTLDVIKNQLIAAQLAANFQATGSAVALFGPAGLLAAAGRIALISAAFGVAKVGIDKLFQVEAPKFEQGGYVYGPRHSSGGVMIEAEGGEYVMNRGAVAAFGPQIEAMNQIGRTAAAPMLAVGDQYSSMLAAMEAIRPEVSVKEIQRVSSRVNVRESQRSW